MTGPSRVYVTGDVVHHDSAELAAEAQGTDLEIMSVHDPILQDASPAVLLDWDYSDGEKREAVLGQLLTRLPRGRVGIHSYNIHEFDEEVLRRKGVRIFHRLEPDAIQWLLNGA